MSTGARQTSDTRSARGSKSDDSVFISVSSEEVEAIVQRAVAAVVKKSKGLLALN